MFFDLNIPIAAPATLKYSNNASKKKGKQKASIGETIEQHVAELFSAAQVEAIEKRIEVLIHCERVLFTRLVSYSRLSGIHCSSTEPNDSIILFVQWTCQLSGGAGQPVKET